MIACPIARRASSQYASQRAATLDRVEMQASVSDDTFRTLTAEDRETLSAPVPADAPYPSPVCTSVLNEEPEAPAVRKTEMEAEEPEAPAVRKMEMETEPEAPVVCKTEMDVKPTPLAASSDDVTTHVLSPAPAAPPAPNTDEQVATTTAWGRRENSHGCYSNRSYTEEEQWTGAHCASVSIEELEAPATCTAEMKAEPAPKYDTEQARLEAVEEMRLWQAERDAALPSRSVRLAIVARAVTNRHGGKHGEWDIKDEPGEGWGAATDEKVSPLAVAEPVKLADNDDNIAPSPSAQSTDGAPTDGMGWGLQEALGCFTMTCAECADDAVTSDDAPEDLDCVRPAAGVQPNAAAAVPIEWSLGSPILCCVACQGACEADEGMNDYWGAQLR